MVKMSVICQNFVQNAWKKDLCSNCFKSVGDHESIEIEQESETSNNSANLNGRYVSQASNGYVARNETPPHTTWKTLISERNNKNSQPFKLENGFQGRLLTINKALNGTDKQSNNGGEASKDRPKSQNLNGISMKTNGDVTKQGTINSETGQLGKKLDSSATNGDSLSNGEKFEGKTNYNNSKHGKATTLNKPANVEEKNLAKTKALDKKQIQAKFTKSKSEVTHASPCLQSILKKSTSTPVDNSQTRRSTNVGFKDEEPLVIGYGGRDFTPEELEWEMASSDGEAENNSDSLDETEDDKVFSKMTKQNTEFNSDNANLMHSKNDDGKNEIKFSKEDENLNCKTTSQHKENETKKISRTETSTNLINEASDRNATHSRSIDEKDKNYSDIDKDSEHTQAEVKIENSGNTNVKETLSSMETEHSETSDSINVAISGDKTSHAAKTSEVTVVKTTEAAVVSGVDVKNNPEFINGTEPPSRSVDAPNKTESGKTADAVMFSDGGETTWQESSTADGNEWQDGEAIPGQILQAINTSLTNRHKMRENPKLSGSIEEEDIGLLQENEFEKETNKISVSVHNQVTAACDEIHENRDSTREEQIENSLNVEPRESFLHGIVSKPSAIYGPASDLFVSRSNSSSSSSSDEQRKSQISLSINVIVNGDDSHQCNENNESENDENHESNLPKDECIAEKTVHSTDNKSKPVIPAKPVKQLSLEKHKQYDKSYSKTIINDETSIPSLKKKDETINEVSYYSSIPDRTRTSINLVDPYAESNIYHEVSEKDLKTQDTEQNIKVPGRESKLAALAIELEQVRHTNTSTKRQAPAPPKVPDPPLEDPPSCTGRISPVAEAPPNFSTFRGESMGFSSASSTTSTSSQDTETGYASWNLHGDSEDHPKYSKSKSSFLLTQYSKCKMLAMGYAEDGAKARKKFSIKKIFKIGKETEASIASDPNCPNPKAWKYSDHFERPRAKLEIIHPMDLENKSVTINPGFESLHSNSMSSFNPNAEYTSFRNSVSSDYGSFYSDTLSPGQEIKQEANYEYIRPRQPSTEDHEESSSKAGTSSSTSPTPSRSSTASQASTVTSGSSKNGAAPPHRPPKPPPPPRAHSLLPGNKTMRNSDGTFKFPAINGDTSSSDEVTVTVTKPQAPRRQCKNAIIRSEYTNLEEHKIIQVPQHEAIPPDEDISENSHFNNQDEGKFRNTSSVQITQAENQIDCEEENYQSVNKPTTIDVTSDMQELEVHEDMSSVNSTREGLYDNLETPVTESKVQASITIKTSTSNQKEKLSKSMLSRNKHPPLTKSPARPPPIYSKPQTGNFPKNVHPWKTLEDSYLALTSSNRELLIKLVNQALKKRKMFASKLNKFEFHWADFEIDASQPSSVFAFGEKIAYHATIPKHPEYSLTLVVSIQQQQNRLQENSEMKYPMFGKFTDCIPNELLDSSGDHELESMPATILVLDRSNILTIECFSESLSKSLTEENEKELCFITLQLIQSLKSLQVQGIESIDTNCQNLLLAKTLRDKYHTLVFLYDICYEESDYSSDSCKISLCQYTLMLLFQMLKIQAIDELASASKFSSHMSRKVFETAFSLLSEEKAVSLSQTKTLFECYLWGVTKVLESLQNTDDCDSILHRWLDIERSNCIKCIVNDDESNDINMQNEYYSQFLIRTNVRNIREIASYL